MLKKLTLITMSVVSAFALHTAEININDKDLEIAGQFDMGQFNDMIEPNTIFVGLKYLNADAANSDNKQAHLESFYEANFLMMKDFKNSDFRIGLGAKINHTKDYETLPLGVEGSYLLPVKILSLYLNASIYYAPSVLSFDNAENYLETRANIDAEIIENGKLTLGYRKIDTNYKMGNFTYNKTWYIGFKFSF